MAAGTIRLPTEGSGKYTQTFENTISGTSVHATAVHHVTSAGISCDPPAGTGLAVCGNVNSGSADSGSPVKVAGKYNATAPTLSDGNRGDLQLDASGNLKVSSLPGDGTKATYRASYSVTFSGTCDEFFTISGSASKTVRVRWARFAAYGGAAALVFQVIKRSAANSGGTSSSATRVPLDSSDAAGTAAVLGYSVTPTSLGTAVGTIHQQAYQVLTSGTAGNTVPLDLKFGDDGGKPIKLSGTAEILGFGFLGSPSLSGSTLLSISIEWTEE